MHAEFVNRAQRVVADLVFHVGRCVQDISGNKTSPQHISLLSMGVLGAFARACGHRNACVCVLLSSLCKVKSK